MTIPEIEQYLHENLPLAAAMGIRVLAVGGEGVRLAVPLAPNRNNHQTAFGGSIASAGILAAWAWIHFRLEAAGLPALVVIQRAATEYHQPISGDYEAFCAGPAPEAWERFVTLLQRRGKARLTLRAALLFGGETAATFTGDFVALGRAEHVGTLSAA